MYDDMLGALAAGQSYDAVMATGSMPAAVARQYGHHEWNWYEGGQCYCNEDFAHEFHQLGFGILGSGDKACHEQVSIKNTAKILTGMEGIAAEAQSAWEPDWYGAPDYPLRALKQYYPERRKTLSASSVFRQFADHEAKLGEGVRGGVYGTMFPHAASAPKEAAVDCGRMFA